MTFAQLKHKAQIARDLLPDYPGLEAALDPEKLQEAVESANPTVIEGAETPEQVLTSLRLDWRRIQRCRTAGEVMAEFSDDAAKLKVVEMYSAEESGDRQRAQETVLNYALGRPIERRMSMEMRVSGASDKELESEITRLLAKFGFEGGERTSSSLLVDPGTRQESEQTPRLQTLAGISTEIPPKPEEN
jgi:hypothetical protein